MQQSDLLTLCVPEPNYSHRKSMYVQRKKSQISSRFDHIVKLHNIWEWAVFLFQDTKFCHIVVPGYQVLSYPCSRIPSFVISLFQDTKFCHILVPGYQVLSYPCSRIPSFVISLFQDTKFCYIAVPPYQILLYCCSRIPSLVILLFQHTKFGHIVVPVYQVLSKSVNKSLEFIISCRLTLV